MFSILILTLSLNPYLTPSSPAPPLGQVVVKGAYGTYCGKCPIQSNCTGCELTPSDDVSNLEKSVQLQCVWTLPDRYNKDRLLVGYRCILRLCISVACLDTVFLELRVIIRLFVFTFQHDHGLLAQAPERDSSAPEPAAAASAASAVSGWGNRAERGAASGCSLTDCFRAFSEEEVLEEQEAW